MQVGNRDWSEGKPLGASALAVPSDTPLSLAGTASSLPQAARTTSSAEQDATLVDIWGLECRDGDRRLGLSLEPQLAWFGHGCSRPRFYSGGKRSCTRRARSALPRSEERRVGKECRSRG